MSKYQGRLTLDGIEYGWNVKRRPRAGEGRLTGHSLYVFVADDQGRDLVLDFPYGELGTFERTEGPAKMNAVLRECIPLALRNGWEPTRRGKSLRLDVSELRKRTVD